MRNRYFLRTQHPGVHLARWNRNKWTACIYFEGKHYHLGTFDTFEEACEARKEATKKFFGEFAPILEAE